MEHGAAVFGLHVLGIKHLPEPVQAAAGLARAHPTRSLRLAAGAVADQPAAVRWRSGPPGKGFAVTERPTGGWVLELEGLGRAELSADGCHATLAPVARHHEWPWFVLNQVVGFAATLQGLEVLHASAVAIDGRAVAITAPSGVGKTTLALALVESGARFLADDALALERVGDTVVAYPGPGIASRVRTPKLRGAGPSATGPSARDKTRAIIADPGVDPVTLGTLVLLERARAGTPTVAAAPLDPGNLLGATRNAVATSPERLESLLALYAAAAPSVRVLRVRTSDGHGAETTARAVLGALQRMRGAP